MDKQKLIDEIVQYFDENIAQVHQENLINKHAKLSSYQINPILVKYLSQLIESGITEEGIAKALFYPRALGTSITGSFGSKFQKMLVDLGLVKGSLIPGMDIEYQDKLDGRDKYCQLKSGPNTINSKDVDPMLSEFDKVANLARANSSKDFSNNDLVVGIMYGDKDQLSAHYLRIDERYPVIIGQEFWERITGYPSFYGELISSIDDLIDSMPFSDSFQSAYHKLVSEIRAANLI
ncbi:MAG: restriction endonuclease [Balneola sp.]|nr:MAG: restriction endonuclease [Balneola sp.]